MRDKALGTRVTKELSKIAIRQQMNMRDTQVPESGNQQALHELRTLQRLKSTDKEIDTKLKQDLFCAQLAERLVTEKIT